MSAQQVQDTISRDFRMRGRRYVLATTVACLLGCGTGDGPPASGPRGTGGAPAGGGSGKGSGGAAGGPGVGGTGVNTGGVGAGGSRSANGGGAGSADAGTPSIGDGGSASDASGAPDTTPTAAQAMLVVPWPAQLIGRPACAAYAPGTKETARWCAFQSQTADGKATELWVVDVAKVASGAARCERSKPETPDCRRLTANLAMVDADKITPQFPSAHAFSGQTLHYYADQKSTVESAYFEGAFYVWQPGWAAPKKLSAATTVCFPTADGSFFHCVEKLTSAGNLIDGDVMTGSAAEGRLTKVVRLHLFKDENPQHSFGYTDRADYMIYSGIEAAEPQTLWVVKATDLADRTKYVRIATGATGWWTGDNDKNLFYFKDFSNDSLSPSGTLMMNDLKTGGREVVVARNVGDFQVHFNAAGLERTISFRDNVKNGAGTLKIIADVEKPVTAPGNLEERAQGVTAAYRMSADLHATFYSKMIGDGVLDAYLAKPGGAPCALQKELKAGDWGKDPFIGKLVVWADNFDPEMNTAEGWYTDLDSCMPRRFTDKLDNFIKLAGGRILFMERDPAAVPISLHYAKLDGTSFPASALRVADDVTPGTVTAVAGGEAVLFSKPRPGSTESGFYYQPLPP